MQNTFFCVHPFYWSDVGLFFKDSPCCILDKTNNTERQHLKDQMLSNRTPDACNRCAKAEHIGVLSKRHQDNAAAASFLETPIEVLEHECIVNSEQEIVFYQLPAGRTCNSACTTCGPPSSSYWSSLRGQINIPAISTHQIDELINFPAARHIGLVGGEPLLCPNTYYILERLAECNPTCKVAISTNGSVTPLNKYAELISKVDIDFCASIDGIGPVFEYMRFPLKWSQIETNLRMFNGSNITVSNLNILYVIDTIRWCVSNKLAYQINVVSNPPMFSPRSLPKLVKHNISCKLQEQDSVLAAPFVKLLNEHTTDDDRLFEQLILEIAEQDHLKGISIEEYLPEFTAMIADK